MNNAIGRLAKNTFFLYALTFSSQLIALVTIPFQTRVLSPEMYGVVGVALSVMTLVSLILDFGIMLSSTPKVARHTEDADYLSRLYSNVFVVKLCVMAICGIVLGFVCAFQGYYRQFFILYALYYVAYCFAALLPDYLYRGLEQMRVIAIRTILVRCLAAVGMFAFLRSDSDVLVLPLFLLVGNAAALALSVRYDRRQFGIRLKKPSFGEMAEIIRDAFPFFFSRVSSTVYSTANPIVLNMFCSGSSAVGFYSASEKFLSITKSLVSPVADSLYPYMVKNKDFGLVKKLLVVSVPIILVFAVVVFLFSDQICLFIFGPGYDAAGNIVRCLLPAIMVIVPSYIVCFPVLVPMGLSNYANASNVVGLCVQLALLVALAFLGKIDVYTICLSTSASEVAVFLFRIAVVIRHRDRCSF